MDSSPESCDFSQLLTKMILVLGASDAIFTRVSEVLNLPSGMESVLSRVTRGCLGNLGLRGLSATCSGVAGFP